MKNRTLYFGDNLEIFRKKIKDESFDLIYLDPPFNSNRKYNQIKNMKENIKEQTTKQETISEVKKRPVWKIILIWIVGIWAVLALVDAVIGLFMFFTIGAEIEASRILGWIIALFIVKELKIIKYKK